MSSKLEITVISLCFELRAQNPSPRQLWKCCFLDVELTVKKAELLETSRSLWFNSQLMLCSSETLHGRVAVLPAKPGLPVKNKGEVLLVTALNINRGFPQFNAKIKACKFTDAIKKSLQNLLANLTEMQR